MNIKNDSDNGIMFPSRRDTEFRDIDKKSITGCSVLLRERTVGMNDNNVYDLTLKRPGSGLEP